MARHIAADGLELFRAVVTETSHRPGADPEDRTYTSYFGPYNKVGTAKAQVTAEKRSAEFTNANNRHYAQYAGKEPTVVTVEGYVEKANVTWEPVE